MWVRRHFHNGGLDWIALDALRPGSAVRVGPINEAHVDMLAQLDGNWPPVLVCRADNTIVDGHYRYLAAQRLGHRRIACVYFDGGRDDAFIEALRCNSGHGLPLSSQERRRAALEVIRVHPDWSDRRVSTLCGVSPQTIGRIRADRTIEDRQPEARHGRDGRRRPVDARSARVQIADVIQSHPEASLREIAQLVGCSPETARRVRLHLAAPPESSSSQGARPAVVKEPAGPKETVVAIDNSSAQSVDSALMSTPEAAAFADWFAQTRVDDEWSLHIGVIPLSRVYEIADEARKRGERWIQFAKALESRVSGRITLHSG
jgi:hypothetical protein